MLNVTPSDENDDDPRLGGSAGLTFAAWVRRANYGSQWDAVFELGSEDGAGGPPADVISLAFGGGGAGMRYLVQNGGSPAQASVLEVAAIFPPWVWVNVIVVHDPDGTATIYWDNAPVATGPVVLPARTVRRSHVFGGAIRRGAESLFRGVLRDVFVTAAAIDDHHRGHLQTHSGPDTSWEQQWRDGVGRDSCGAAGCVCSSDGAAPASAASGRRLQGVPQAVPDTPTGYIASLLGGNASSALGVHGGSLLLISGQFGEVAYPEGQAPVVMVGTTRCVVDLLESTARRIHCTLDPLTDDDLAGQSGVFTLDLTVYTPQAVETDSGQIVAAANPATCTLTDGCKVQFDLASQPVVSSLRTGV